MKKTIILLILFFAPFFVYATDFELTSDSVVVYNYKDNKLLYEKNSDKKVSIASMTKLMTALVTVKNVDNLNKKVTITNNDFNNIANLNLATAGFKVGDRVTYNDLLYGLLFLSGAECANTLYNNVFNNPEKFIENMNDLANEIGMKDSSFSNPIGYDDTNNYSTVKDVYKLFTYALQNKKLNKILNDTNYITTNNLTFKNKVINRYNSNKNNLGIMKSGKTGTTKEAGYALVSLVSYNEAQLITVTSKTPLVRNAYYNYQDAEKIYNYYFKNYDYKDVIKKNKTIIKLPTKYATSKKVAVGTKKNIEKYINKKSNITYKYKGIKVIKFNTSLNKKIGNIEIYVDNKKVATADAYILEELHFSLKNFLKNNKIIIIIIVLLIVIVFFNCKGKKKKKKKYLKKH